MARRLACLALLCIISVSFVFFTSVSTQVLYGVSVDQTTSRYYGPVPSVVLVSISKNESQPHYFSMVDNTVKSRLGENVLSTLKSYGLLQTRIVYRDRDYCTYALLFEQVGTESDIISYLQSLPEVIKAKRDYPIQFLIEPNDHYYQPDSVDYSHHYVPDDMNTYVNEGNYVVGRICSALVANRWDTCCCEAPCDTIVPYYFSYFDSVHMNDQWVLQRTQVNKAWDIEKGDGWVKVMIIDSGVDIDHPDLENRIWNNSLDPQWDANHDGLPGGGLGFNNPIFDKDIDNDGHFLFGEDHLCDAGPDGDYGFGPNGIDDYPDGPGGGDDDTLVVDGYDAWDDNLRGPGSPNPEFDDDFEDIVFMKCDDDANGYPDDTYGVNVYDFIQDFGLEGADGLPGVKGWGDGDIDKDGGKHFNDYEVRMADFDGDDTLLCGPDGVCDAGPDGDYGFGKNAIDDFPDGPGGEDDDLGPAWADNLRGPGSLHPELKFDDDMDDVKFLRFDNEEDGDPFGYPRDDSCPKAFGCHGTAMAGIIGAETNNGIGMAGYVWDCTLLPVKVAIGLPEYEYIDPWNWNPQAAVSRLKKALDYAIEKKVDIVNMSLGHFTENREENPLNDPTLQQKINEAYETGIIIVAAAGNFPDSVVYCYPASFDHVISVSGVNRFEQKASYVTYNDAVDVCAPIGDINVEVEKSPTSYCVTTAYMNNPHTMIPEQCDYHCHGYVFSPYRTSGAAAEVSGLAALLVSLYPKTLVEEMFPTQYSPQFYVDFIESEIKRGAIPVDTAQGNVGQPWQYLLGAGRINAYRSMTQWGHISTDTTWKKFVYISGDIIVDEGVTLTIEPGTIIQVASWDNDNLVVGDPDKINFEVWGTLIANGSAENPIIFKSLAEVPEPGDWIGIFIGENSGGSISHCKIYDAKWGIRVRKTIQISNCEIRNCSIAGIYIWESGASITDCIINSNNSDEAAGVLIWNCQGTVTVEDCTINSNVYGIWVSNARPDILNCDIKNNLKTGIMVTQYQSSILTWPSIEWCKIQGNDQNGMYFDSGGQVSNTKIWENGYGIYCRYSSSSPFIDHSKIIQNDAAGVRAANSAQPVLGDVSLGRGQNNSVYDQPIYVYTTPQNTIMAENCYWGTQPGIPPHPNKFKGDVDYDPFLESDPVAYLAPKSKSRPTVLSLSQSYPNPSIKSGTTIQYSIPSENERVTLIIYDVSGRRIKTLVNKVQAAGIYRVRWDAKNNRGRAVAPGIYFYQMIVGNKALTKKMVLLK